MKIGHAVGVYLYYMVKDGKTSNEFTDVEGFLRINGDDGDDRAYSPN